MQHYVNETQIKIYECSEEDPKNWYIKYIDHELQVELYPLQKSHVNWKVTT